MLYLLDVLINLHLNNHEYLRVCHAALIRHYTHTHFFMITPYIISEVVFVLTYHMDKTHYTCLHFLFITLFYVYKLTITHPCNGYSEYIKHILFKLLSCNSENTDNLFHFYVLTILKLFNRTRPSIYEVLCDIFMDILLRLFIYFSTQINIHNAL